MCSLGPFSSSKRSLLTCAPLSPAATGATYSHTPWREGLEQGSHWAGGARPAGSPVRGGGTCVLCPAGCLRVLGEDEPAHSDLECVCVGCRTLVPSALSPRTPLVNKNFWNHEDAGSFLGSPRTHPGLTSAGTQIQQAARLAC